MKKYILTLLLLAASSAQAQWVNATADNGFDPPFRYSTCDDKIKKGKWLKVEKFKDTQVLLLIYVGFACEDFPKVEYSFKMDTGYHKINSVGAKSSDKKKIYLQFDVAKESGEYFAKCKELKIRITDSGCGTEIYQFDMTGSANAYTWVDEDPRFKKKPQK